MTPWERKSPQLQRNLIFYFLKECHNFRLKGSSNKYIIALLIQLIIISLKLFCISDRGLQDKKRILDLFIPLRQVNPARNMLSVTSYRGIKAPPLTKTKVVLGMTQNWIWWWGSTSRDLESVQYSFIAFNPSSILTRFLSPTYGLWRNSISRGSAKSKTSGVSSTIIQHNFVQTT